MSTDYGDEGLYSFTVASVEEWPDEDLVVLHVVEVGTPPVVLLTDDFVAMMVSLSVRLGQPINEIRLEGMTLTLGPDGIPFLQREP